MTFEIIYLKCNKYQLQYSFHVGGNNYLRVSQKRTTDRRSKHPTCKISSEMHIPKDSDVSPCRSCALHSVNRVVFHRHSDSELHPRGIGVMGNPRNRLMQSATVPLRLFQLTPRFKSRSLINVRPCTVPSCLSMKR